jgi:hypothetical protein
VTAASGIDSGYVLESLNFPLQSIRGAAPEAGAQAAEWGWDWRWKDRDHFEVGIAFSGPPISARPEKIEVAVNAVFLIVGEIQTVPVGDFAHGPAVALLFPYLRQVVDDLTSRSPFGRVLLPPTNTLALMSKFDASQARGSRQSRPVQ